MSDRIQHNDNSKNNSFQIPEHNPLGDWIAQQVAKKLEKMNPEPIDKWHPAPVVLNKIADDKNRSSESAQKFLPEVTIHHN